MFKNEANDCRIKLSCVCTNLLYDGLSALFTLVVFLKHNSCKLKFFADLTFPPLSISLSRSVLPRVLYRRPQKAGS